MENSVQNQYEIGNPLKEAPKDSKSEIVLEYEKEAAQLEEKYNTPTIKVKAEKVYYKPSYEDIHILLKDEISKLENKKLKSSWEYRESLLRINELTSAITTMLDLDGLCYISGSRVK